MNQVIIIGIIVGVILLLVNGRDIINLIWTDERKYPAQRIEKGEYALTKPAGFKVADDVRLFTIHSARATGAITIVEGRQIKEEFSCAWAVVSVTKGDCIDICRKVAIDHSDEVISELDETVAGQRILTITTKKKTPTYFVITTTHKAIMSPAHDKTYELRVSLLNNQKPEYGKAVSQILESFEVRSPSSGTA